MKMQQIYRSLHVPSVVSPSDHSLHPYCLLMTSFPLSRRSSLLISISVLIIFISLLSLDKGFFTCMSDIRLAACECTRTVDVRSFEISYQSISWWVRSLSLFTPLLSCLVSSHLYPCCPPLGSFIRISLHFINRSSPLRPLLFAPLYFYLLRSSS